MGYCLNVYHIKYQFSVYKLVKRSMRVYCARQLTSQIAISSYPSPYIAYSHMIKTFSAFFVPVSLHDEYTMKTISRDVQKVLFVTPYFFFLFWYLSSKTELLVAKIYKAMMCLDNSENAVYFSKG